MEMFVLGMVTTALLAYIAQVSSDMFSEENKARRRAAR